MEPPSGVASFRLVHGRIHSSAGGVLVCRYSLCGGKHEPGCLISSSNTAWRSSSPGHSPCRPDCPSQPLLSCSAPALSGSGRMNLALAIGATMVAALGADVLWYALGRSLGLRVFGTLCRFSLDPDSLVRDAKERFLSHRGRYLVVAKFLPGLNPLAAGLAGVASLRPDRFLTYAASGAFLLAGAWIVLGYACSDAIG